MRGIGAAVSAVASHQLTPLGRRAPVIREIADAFARRAAPVTLDLWKTRFPAPELATLSRAQATAGVAELSRLLPWVDDGNCFARGVIGAGRIEQQVTGHVTAGVRGATEGAELLHAAVAVVPTSRAKTGWTFHAATAVRIEGQEGVRIIDLLLSPDGAPLSLDRWARAVGRRASDVRIQHPLDNIPTGSGPITVPASSWHLRQLGDAVVQSLPRG